MACYDLIPGEVMELRRGPRAGVTAVVERVIGSGAMMFYKGYSADLEGRFVRWSAKSVQRASEEN